MSQKHLKLQLLLILVDAYNDETDLSKINPLELNQLIVKDILEYLNDNYVITKK